MPRFLPTHTTNLARFTNMLYGPFSTSCPEPPSHTDPQRLGHLTRRPCQCPLLFYRWIVDSINVILNQWFANDDTHFGTLDDLCTAPRLIRCYAPAVGLFLNLRKTPVLWPVTPSPARSAFPND